MYRGQGWMQGYRRRFNVYEEPYHCLGISLRANGESPTITQHLYPGIPKSRAGIGGIHAPPNPVADSPRRAEAAHGQVAAAETRENGAAARLV
jgi:hypothetical protein